MLRQSFDWHKLRFLESSSNLKPLVKARTGREISTTVARGIAVCLQQGRLFLEAAANSPLEIRPLLMFYGQIGFAKALVIAMDRRGIAGMPRAHGLRDVSPDGSRLKDLTVKVHGSGTFQDYNDVLSPLNRICYSDTESTPTSVYLPSATSDQLDGIEITMKEVLSRIPGLEDLYSATFQEPAKADSFQIAAYEDNYFELYLWDRRRFSDRDSLRAIVEDLRARHPFLSAWRLNRAGLAHGKSFLEFANIVVGGKDEFGDELKSSDGILASIIDARRDPTIPRSPIKSVLAPVGGREFGTGGYAISPFKGLYISEFSFHYMALFLLSTLVRYHPDRWVNALSRSMIDSHAPDDEILALLDLLLERSARSITYLVVSVLNPHEDEFP